jgi:hypothetical protein
MNTIWAPLAEIRISEKAARTLSRATVERYRQWLEQGARHRRSAWPASAKPSSFATAGTASLPRSRPGTP